MRANIKRIWVQIDTFYYFDVPVNTEINKENFLTYQDKYIQSEHVEDPVLINQEILEIKDRSLLSGDTRHEKKES